MEGEILTEGKMGNQHGTAYFLLLAQKNRSIQDRLPKVIFYSVQESIGGRHPEDSPLPLAVHI